MMKNGNQEIAATKEDQIYGGPTKRFFVSMLTRDIDLDDAILDLIDNCVDGAMRQVPKGQFGVTPYAPFHASLQIAPDFFSLEDNCGGIPDSRLDAAFRLGRPQTELDSDIPTIGMYGIGMKRAIFKMGQEATVESSSDDGVRKITYSKTWMDDESADSDQHWELPIERRPPRRAKGVKIKVEKIRNEARNSFKNKFFVEDLIRKISKHFGYIILKGFVIKINGVPVKPTTLHLFVGKNQKKSINPFDYVHKFNDVTIRIIVGFHRPLPPPDEIDDDLEASRSRDEAGISVICNDRVILDKDTTFRTGWGTRTVPKFHNQFMAISGIMSFTSNNANSLPVSTTKTGVEMDSEVYDHALTICAAALKSFTTFTNRWKSRVGETAIFFDQAERSDAILAVRLATSKSAQTLKSGAHQFKPDLPIPVSGKEDRRISFVKPTRQIDEVSLFLFNEKRSPAEVGIECFEKVHKEAAESSS